MKHPAILPCLIGLLTAGLANAQQDALAIVRRADEATRAVRNIRYESRSFGPRVSALAAVVSIRNAHGDQPMAFRVELSTNAEDPTASPRQTIVGAGGLLLTVDHLPRSYELDEAPAKYLDAIPSPNPDMRVSMIEYVHDHPFDDELNSPMRYEGRRAVRGVECDVVFVEYARVQQRARWYFGVADGLPRRVDRFVADPAAGRPGADADAFTLELANLQVDPDFDDAVFKMTPPEHYRNTSAGKQSSTLPIGAGAPDVEFQSDAGPRRLSEFQGRTVVLQFRAPWCRHSAAAAADFQRMRERFEPRGVVFATVLIWGDLNPGGVASAPATGLSTLPPEMQLKAGDAVLREMKINSVPTTYVIGPDGVILFADDHYSPRQERQMSSLLDITSK